MSMRIPLLDLQAHVGKCVPGQMRIQEIRSLRQLRTGRARRQFDDAVFDLVMLAAA